MKTSKSSRGFAANLNRYPGDWGAICPAARMESLLEPRGARALIFVPRLACESIENVPFRTLSRSSILMRPSPRRCFAPQSLSWLISRGGSMIHLLLRRRQPLLPGYCRKRQCSSISFRRTITCDSLMPLAPETTRVRTIVENVDNERRPTFPRG
jgi:hypothetical protein